MAQTTETQRAATQSMEAMGVVAPPPLLFGGILMLGLTINRFLPVPFMPRGTARLAGGFLGIAGLLLGGSAIREMRRAGTSPLPQKPTTAVVQTGPYSLSRNPIYLAMSMTYAGITTFANALWPLLFLPAVLFEISRDMVEREEHYLELRFGEEYRQYRARVRPWI